MNLQLGFFLDLLHGCDLPPQPTWHGNRVVVDRRLGHEQDVARLGENVVEPETLGVLHDRAFEGWIAPEVTNAMLAAARS